jgi:hypothetical protein
MSAARRVFLAIGAPVLVVVGLAGIWGARNAAQLKHQIELWGDALEHSPNAVVMDLPAVPIWVGGERIGRLESITVERHAPATVDSLQVRISLSENQDVDHWSSCYFRFDPDAFDRKGPLGFLQATQCLDSQGDLVRFGTVTFAGADQSAGLYLAADDLPCDHMAEEAEACSELNRDIRKAMTDLKSEIRMHIRNLEIR